MKDLYNEELENIFRKEILSENVNDNAFIQITSEVDSFDSETGESTDKFDQDTGEEIIPISIKVPLSDVYQKRYSILGRFLKTRSKYNESTYFTLFYFPKQGVVALTTSGGNLLNGKDVTPNMPLKVGENTLTIKNFPQKNGELGVLNLKINVPQLKRNDAVNREDSVDVSDDEKNKEKLRQREILNKEKSYSNEMGQRTVNESVGEVNTIPLDKNPSPKTWKSKTFKGKIYIGKKFESEGVKSEAQILKQVQSTLSSVFKKNGIYKPKLKLGKDFKINKDGMLSWNFTISSSDDCVVGNN